MTEHWFLRETNTFKITTYLRDFIGYVVFSSVINFLRNLCQKGKLQGKLIIQEIFNFILQSQHFLFSGYCSRVGKVVLVDAKNDIHQNHLVAILQLIHRQRIILFNCSRLQCVLFFVHVFFKKKDIVTVIEFLVWLRKIHHWHCHWYILSQLY